MTDTPESSKCCSNCDHCHAHDDEQQCWAHPPQSFVVPDPKNRSVLVRVSMFPEVKPDWVCGEFLPIDWSEDSGEQERPDDVMPHDNTERYALWNSHGATRSEE